MKANLILWLIASSFFGLFGCNALAGDTTCYGHKSETNYFVCGAHGNCTWWAAAKRPDLAAVRSGSGWNAVQWYDKFKSLGFPVGRRPKAGAVAVFDATANNEAGHVYEGFSCRKATYEQLNITEKQIIESFKFIEANRK